MSIQLPVVSLFSGAGGLDLAAEQATQYLNTHDVRVAVATDYEPQALETLSLNMPQTETLAANIQELSSEALLQSGGISASDVALLIGGPPCTPFSKSGFWISEKRESRDPNASLLDDYVRMVREIRPKAFILENVQGLTYKTHAVQFQRLIRSLTELGYNPTWKVLIAADYGVPQLRRRVFVVGARDGRRLNLPESTHSGWSEHTKKFDTTKLPYVTSRDALSDLYENPVEADEIVEGDFGELASEVPPGQNYLWHTERYEGRNEFKWRSRYWTFLLRLDPERPSSTIQAQPGPWVGPFHWENVLNDDGQLRARRLRVNEIKRLMTFPDNFHVVGDRMDVQRQLGNAVPVELGAKVIASVIQQVFEGSDGVNLGGVGENMRLPLAI